MLNILNIATFRNIVKSKYTGYILKTLIFSVLSFYIFLIVREKQILDKDFEFYFLKKNTSDFILLFLSVILFPVNWALEAYKWKLLVRKAQSITLLKALKGIFTGVAFGFATPHGIGDYFGRILQLSGKNRIRLIGAVFVSRITQFVVTFILGTGAVLYFMAEHYFQDVFIFNLLVLIFALANVLLLAFFFYQKPFVSLLKKIPLFSWLYRYFEIIRVYNANDFRNILFLSFVRYLVFTLQFVLLFVFFEVELSFVLLAIGACFTFLVKSIVPTLFELGVRESSALYFFGFYHIADDKILLASLTLWVINILLPTFIGLFMVFKIKIFEKW